MAEAAKRTKRAAPAKKSATKRSQAGAAGKPARKSQGQARKPRARAEARPRPKPMQVASRIAEQLAELTGKIPESVTAIERNDDGWTIQLEVVESRRIPDSADMLALYLVEADSSGDLMGYRRQRRYARGHSGDDPEANR